MSFTDGPSSYLALRLNASGGPPALLWSADAFDERDRLPPGVSEAAPIVPPAVSPDDGLFFYWSATAPPRASPPPASPAPELEGGAGGAGSGVAAEARSGQPLRQLLQEEGSPLDAPYEEGLGSPSAAAPAPSPASPPANSNDTLPVLPSPEPIPPEVVAPETEGVGQVAPEGFTSTPV